MIMPRAFTTIPKARLQGTGEKHTSDIDIEVSVILSPLVAHRSHKLSPQGIYGSVRLAVCGSSDLLV